MFDPKKIEQIVKQLQETLPNSIKTLGGDVELKVKEVLQAQLSKLDVVSREEFDIQTEVLLRTRQKLTLLEEKLAALEQKLS
ncbi:MAG: ubiquinone biosynthesis accessory factor UbiK [Vibrionaceae bacterium]